MRKFVINLDEDVERLQRYLRDNCHITDIERFPAILGSKLDRKVLGSKGYISGDLLYRDGTMGLAMSHISLWENIVRDNEPFLITEDDAHFARNFDEMSKQLLAFDPEWDIITWGFNFNSYVWADMLDGISRVKIKFSELDLRKQIHRWAQIDIKPTLIRLRHQFGLCGYSLSPVGAKKLLDMCLPIRNEMIDFGKFGVRTKNRSFDSWVNRTLPKLNAYVSIPPLVVTPNDPAQSPTKRVNEGVAHDASQGRNGPDRKSG